MGRWWEGGSEGGGGSDGAERRSWVVLGLRGKVVGRLLVGSEEMCGKVGGLIGKKEGVSLQSK